MADDAPTVRRFRRPWYWLTVLLIATVLSTLLFVGNARSIQAQNDRQFTTAQQLRFNGLKRALDDLFTDAVQLASSGAEIFGRSAPNRPFASQISRNLYASALNRHIYGLGAFFAPESFVGPNPLESVYVRQSDPDAPHLAIDHPYSQGVEVDQEVSAQRPVANYRRSGWFHAGMRAYGHTIVVGPYGDGRRKFISVLRAFARNGRPAGVVSVDVLLPEFVRIMQRSLGNGDVAAIYRRGPGHQLILSTAPVSSQTSQRAVLRGSLRFTPHSDVELSSDASMLHRGNQTLWLITSLLIVGLWAAAALIAIGVVQRWRAIAREYDLEAEHARLERTIAIARSVEDELRKAAYTDALTGLPNRAAFLERAREAVRSANESYAVFFIDLDRFNRVNETLGHLAGDELLRTIGARIASVLETSDMVARLGGDEFVVLGKVDGSTSASDVATMLLSHLGEPIVVQGRTLYPEASVGVVVPDASYESAEELLRDADIAMYEAKRRGRAQHVIFDAEMRRRVADDLELEAALRRALERGDLVPYYQPVVSVRTGRIAGFEALVRWHRGNEVVSAADFMPFAETHGLVAAIDVRVMLEVFAHSRAIYDCFPGSKIAINISASELEAAGLAETIERMRGREGHPGDRLELEITETTMMTNSEGSRRTIERLREFGIDFVLDDFGTGYSSLAYLQGLPISGIKIDRTFVAPLPDDGKAVEIVRSIVLLARSMDLSVTAEGVETIAQFELLRELDVDFAQGFFFSAAVDMASLMLLQARSISLRPAVE